LQERFELPGWVEPEQVIARYAKSDILLLPSLSEGFPVVGVQAMGMGLALVLSQIGGCMDLVIPGENGFLVDLKKTAGFENALRPLLTDYALLLACRLASRRIAPRYNLDQVLTAYETVLLSASGTIARGVKS
jgi:glycosyltransferase involved in cell wall biosynthesis